MRLEAMNEMNETFNERYRYAEGVRGGVCGGVCGGGTQRGYALPIATIDLVGDNREFEV